ncbi:MAG TPA: vitamin K epoxide reductase family protein [Myxococcota bacterium]|nr:vitamin K epoxide reductase family protein [Myxococcota bacterium]
MGESDLSRADFVGLEPRRINLAIGVIALLCLLGIGIAVDLTGVFVLSRVDPDYQSFCAVSEGMNCETVALSRYSTVAGVPIAIWGIAGYSFVLILSILSLIKRIRLPGPGLLVVMGVLMVGVGFYLIYVMHFLIKSFCILCIALDVINVAILVLAIIAARARHGGCVRSVVLDIAAVFKRPVLVVVIAILGFGSLGAAYTLGPKYLASKGIQTGGQSLEFVKSGTVFAPSDKGKATDPQTCGRDGAAIKAPLTGLTDDGHHWIGGEDPRVEIHEFTDYECPHCRKAHMMVRKLVASDRHIRVYHRHLPLDMACNPAIQKPFHARACELSKVAVCAGQQGRFWEMNDFLFQKSDDIRAKNWTADDIAQRLELDLDKFRCCMDDPGSGAIIDSDIAEANGLGLKGTPAFVINGQIYYGKVPDEALKHVRD